jgi:hypothetical protein
VKKHKIFFRFLASVILCGLSYFFATSCGSGGQLPIATMSLLRLDDTELLLTAKPIPRAIKVKVAFFYDSALTKPRALKGNEQAAIETGLVFAQGAAAIAHTFTWAADNKSIAVTPTPWLKYHTTYTVGITDTAATGAAQTNFTTAVKNDINGDGFADIVIGAPGVSAGGIYRGQAYLFRGSASGIKDCDLSSCTADATITGAADYDMLGQPVAIAGDVNADGYADILIGASGRSQLGPKEGHAYVFLGGQTLSGELSLTSAVATITGANATDTLGTAVAAAGDVDADGYDDLIVGAWGASGQKGEVYVFRGGPTLAGSLAPSNAATILIGPVAGVGFGFVASSAGDVNADGFSDIIVAAPSIDVGPTTNAGEAFVLLGSASGIKSCDPSSSPCRPDVMILGAAANDNLGGSVSTVGDVNKDGLDDIIVGAREANSGKGAAYIFSGGTALSGTLSPSNAGATFSGAVSGDRLGAAVSNAGDINADGNPDITIGAYTAKGGGSNRGRAYIIMGSASGIGSCDLTSCTIGTTIPGAIITGSVDDDRLGSIVSAVGDVNGDGCDDVMITAPGAAGSKGRVYIFLGAKSTNGLSDCNLSAGCVVGSADHPGATITGETAFDGLGTPVFE